MDVSSKEAVGAALAAIPSGCSILTTRTSARRTGMLASWVQQAGFEPPMVSVAVNKERWLVKLLEESGALVLNAVGDDPAPLFKHFGKGFGPEEDAFAGLACRVVDGGVVLENCAAWLAARIRARHDAGDHWLYLAEVTDGGANGMRPYVHVRKNGFSY